MKMLKRTLAMFMVLCMMFSIVPMTVFADDTAGTAVTASAEADDFIRVFHLDCGRKYFTVEQVKELIDAISAAYYTHMELAIGNDGLRLLLDDMSVTANGTTYASDTVKSGIQSGNAAYSHSGEWTQAEMDEIISYADSKNIEIIPLVNTPGHMNSILDTLSSLVNTDLSYNNDPRTIDITNETAVTLSQALVAKYIAYFASKGCTYFHMGADEYANTTYSSGSMGFGHLQSENQYDAFVSYVNEVAKLITDAGMIPVAFNDGIYYNNVTNKGTFDPNIVISYWSSGWSNYNVASASTLVSKGHKILNTNDAWYYVLGRSTGNTYSYTTAQNGAQNTAVTKVTGDNSSAVTPIGVMQCVWCDTPSVNYSSTEINRIENLITTLSSNNTNYFVKPEEPEIPVTPEEPENVTQTDNGVSVTAPGLESIVVKVNDAVVTEEKVSKTYSITLNDGNYTDAATVKIPYDSAFDGCNKFVGRVGEDEFEVTKDGDFFICEVPHFSDVEIEGYAVEEDTVTSSGGTAASYVLDTNGLDAGSQYLIVYKNSSSSTTGYALNTSKESTNVTISGSNVTSSADLSNALWLYSTEISGSNWNQTTYHMLSNGNLYLYTTRSGYSYNRTYTLNITNTKQYVSLDGNLGIYTISNINNNSYVSYTNGTWGAQSSEQSLYFYKYTPGTATFTVDASLQESRIAALTVENDNYTDASWTTYESALKAAENKLTTVESTPYSSENAANTALNELIAAVDALETAKNALEKAVSITINYVASGKTVKTETKKVSGNATSVTLESLITGNDGETYAVNNTTLALESEKFEYSVIVTLDTTPPNDALTGTSLTVEQWITNIHATTTKGVSTYTFTVSSSEAATAEGIEITKKAPENAYWSEGMLYYWQSVRLDADNEQTTGAGDDETADGTTFTHVRYHNSAWQYKDTAGKWNYFLEDDQAVAYYLQKIKLTDEVNTYFKDWGWNLTNEDGYSHVGLSVAVVYPDGTLSGTEDEIYKNATILYNYESGQKNIGLISPENNSIYTIAKITVTPGTYTGSGTVNWSEDAGIDWSKTTNEAGSTWYDEKTVWDAVTNAGTTPMVNGSLSSANFPNGIYWDKGGEAWLILIYLDTIHYDTNLMVQWVDDSSAGALISKMEVSVTYEEGEAPITYFNGLKQTSAVPTVDGTLTLDDNAYVENSSGFNQTFNKDITIIPNVATQYRSGLYQYTGAEIADDGMTLILHYNINMAKLTPLYVIDFGLPVSFPFSDMVKNPEDLTNVVIDSCSYGEVAVDMTKQIITFTPTDILQNIAVVKITVTYENGTTSTFRMGFVPATTVYYDESFLDYDSNWKITTMGSNDDVKTDVGAQAKEAPGQKLYNYGYDPAYADSANGSGNTAASTSTAGATASFTFTGTGFELYGNSKDASGIVSVLSQGKINKIYMIDTKLSVSEDDATIATNKLDTEATYYSLPFISEKNLDYGTYTVTIKKSASGEAGSFIYIDGVRIINTIDESHLTEATAEQSIYYKDAEDRPEFYQLRDMVLNAIGVNNVTDSQYGTPASMAGQVYNATNGASAIIFDESISYGAGNAQDLLDNGPKNELYLYPGQTLTFKVTTDRVMQLGLKSPIGSATFAMTVNGSAVAPASLSTSVDMFYPIAAKGGTTHTVSITVNSGLLSVTDLKICDDPNAAFVPLTQADIENVLSSIAGVPEEPVITYADAELNVRFVDYTGRVISSGSLTANGVTGTDMTFSASDILGAASMPARYAFVDADSVTDAIVACGESETVTVQIGRVATLRVVYMNLFGRKLDTVVITRVQTEAGYAVIPASEIRSQAPAGARVIWPIPTYVSYGSSVIVTVPVV